MDASTLFSPFQAHGLGEAVAGGLEHQRVVRRLDVAGVGVVLALHLGREHGGQQVVGAHPLQRRRHLLAPAECRSRARKREGVPTPAGSVQGAWNTAWVSTSSTVLGDR